jgi:ABC-type branched-subunit amino acid transport system ATPase component/ABC-type branched-subunit amino acid transport system permease subunit
VLGLGWFLGRTDAGVAVRAAAENRDRARLLAVPVQRLSTLVWATSGLLSAVTILLVAPSQGMSNSLGAAPVVLLPALAAAVIAKMSSLGKAFVAATALGVVDQLVRWHFDTKSLTTVVFLVVIVLALVLRHEESGRGEDDAGLTGGGPARQEDTTAPPARLRQLRAGWLGLVAVAALVAPLVLSTTDLFLFTSGVLYAVVAVSLVVLTGWAGQISLGQFGLVGIGAVVSANLVLRWNLDLFWSLALSGLAGAAVAVVIGLPALRIRGPFLAVTTLAFAVAADSYAFNPNNFPNLLPFSVDRPMLFDRVGLASERSFAYLTLAALAVTLGLVAGLRRGRPGRTILAVRDNQRAAAALTVSAAHVKLAAFVLSGAIAGVAGGLHVHLIGGLGNHSYDPSLSLAVFSMAVIGGIESPGGVLAGVALVQITGRLFPTYQVILTGVGVLVLLLVLPGGLAELGNRLLARLAGLRRSAATPADEAAETTAAVASGPVDPAAAAAETTDVTAITGDVLLRCEGVKAAYGPMPVLFGIDLAVGDGEVVALLGTNGAGKSSLLRAVTGLLPSSAGHIVFDGQRIDTRSVEAIATAGIAMVPGGRGVFPSLTVSDNLRVAAWAFRGDGRRVAEARERVLTLFPVLRDRLDQRAGTMSGGEQQMLALAQAFLGSPRLLLIDELSLGLAPTVVAELLEVVRGQVASGVTVVLVEQSVNVALTVAKRAVFLEKGEVRFTGPTAELLERPDVLHSVFLTGHAPHRPAAPAAALPSGDGAVSEAEPGVVLSCSGLVKRFGGVTAVADVDLEVRQGQVLGLIGHNGAGKTTLFDLLSGFLTPEEGRVHVCGHDVTGLAPAERAQRGLGRSFQEAKLFPALTVSETLAVALDRHLDGRGDGFIAAGLRLPAALDNEVLVHARVEEIVEELGLARYANTPVSFLSTGTRRIVELGCMLAAEPQVLLLDEPSAGVAQRETEHLGPLLRRVQAATGCSIVVIEHDMALLADLCDELVALEHGAVIASGPPDEVLNHPLVISSYLGTDEATVARSGSMDRRSPRRAPLAAVR